MSIPYDLIYDAFRESGLWIINYVWKKISYTEGTSSTA